MPRRRRWKYLPVELRREIMRLAAKGTRTTEIVEKVDVSQFAVLRAIRPLGGMVRPDMLAATPSRLSLEDRVEIRIGLEQHESLGATARRLGRSVSTISREVKRNGGL
jgi:IS30 family transposase